MRRISLVKGAGVEREWLTSMVCPPFVLYSAWAIAGVSSRGLPGNEGRGFAGPGPFRIRGWAHHHILRERRAIDGEAAVEKGVPGNAENIRVIEYRDGIGDLRSIENRAILNSAW
jgi:hypothetical protein